MTYPTAIVIAAALIAGAILMSDPGRAASDNGSVALAAEGNSAWMARANGGIRFCRVTTPDRVGIECSDFE